jgi:hypothetical protein
VSSKFLLGIETEVFELRDYSRLSVPHLDAGDRLIGQKFAQIKVHRNSLTCRMRIERKQQTPSLAREAGVDLDQRP